MDDAIKEFLLKREQNLALFNLHERTSEPEDTMQVQPNKPVPTRSPGLENTAEPEGKALEDPDTPAQGSEPSAADGLGVES